MMHNAEKIQIEVNGKLTFEFRKDWMQSFSALLCGW